MRRVVVVVLLAGLLVGLLLAATPAAAVVLTPPVAGAVVARFEAPTRYGAGHRGVDLAAPPGTPVRAAAAGRVAFAGRVVGATWVTVDHGTLRTTVGPLAVVRVRAGDRVAAGTVLGASARAHGRDAVHWSARRGDSYVDPLALGRRIASLVPVGEVDAVRWPRTRVR